MLTLLLTLATTTAGIGVVEAQPAPGWLVCDSAGDRVIRLEDLDGDGVLSATEAFVFYDDSSDGPDLSTPNHLIAWNDGYLLSDGGTVDAILRLEDLNGDGDANDAGEVVPFYDDSSPGPDLSVPGGLAIAPDGALFVSDDGAGVRAILRLVDLDGNGDALGAGEVTVFCDETAPIDPPMSDPESVAVAADGTVYVGDSSTGRILRLVDLDGDGTAFSAGEGTAFYDATGTVPLSDIDALQVDGAGRVYAVDEDNGTVLRLEDLNGDGDALDSGELILFHDGTAAGALIGDANDAILIGPGQLAVADGGLDGIALLEDLDGDGAALAANETTILFDDGGVTFSTPHGVVMLPVDGPPPVGITLTAVDPMLGDALGGTTVTLTGSGFAGTLTVDFGGATATATVTSSTTATVVAPAHLPALVDVAISAGSESAALPGAFRYQHRFLRGDVDLDGELRLSDPILVLYHLFVPGAAVPACLDAADANDDDTLALEDPMLVLTYMFAGGPPPMMPFPEAGFDPTPFGPGCDTPLVTTAP